MNPILHPQNFYFGWSLVLAGFASGAAIGMGFHRDNFLGGYDSLRRRLVRLGHIALVALGVIHVLFSISAPANGAAVILAASICFMVGALTMPAVCILAAWRSAARQLFFIPVLALVAAVILVLFGASP